MIGILLGFAVVELILIFVMRKVMEYSEIQQRFWTVAVQAICSAALWGLTSFLMQQDEDYVNIWNSYTEELTEDGFLLLVVHVASIACFVGYVFAMLAPIFEKAVTPVYQKDEAKRELPERETTAPGNPDFRDDPNREPTWKRLQREREQNAGEETVPVEPVGEGKIKCTACGTVQQDYRNVCFECGAKFKKN